MQLIENWKAVTLKAWSMRLMAISLVFDVLERALPYLDPTMFPPGAFGWLSIITLIGAAGTRILYQPEVSNASPAPQDPKPTA
jgi:hypothetical protein